MTVAACALGVRRPVLDDALAGLLRAARPWGLILFREACVDPEQVRRLCGAMREACGHDAIVWIDQEGGRVARLRPPAWPAFPPARRFGAIHALDPLRGIEAVGLGHRLMAQMLKAIGVNGDFAPVLDLDAPGADPVVMGDRTFSANPAAVAALGRAALEGLAAGGVAGCVKHLPGHGRSEVDTHYHLPRVSADRAALAADMAPFQALRDAPAAMTAHIVYEAYDPERPATWSPTVIADVIRGAVGFDGLLMSDDLDMKALDGPLRTRAERAFAAGCDLVLQCSGAIADMEDVVAGCPRLEGRAAERAAVVEAIARSAPTPFDAAAAEARFAALLADGGALA